MAYYDFHNKVTWAGLNHGHWGAKLHLKRDGNEEFEEVVCPAFPREYDKSFVNFWCIASDSTGRVYVGAEPAALFYSDDLGQTWYLNEGLWNIHGREEWMGGGTDNPCLHSIQIEDSNPSHFYVAISCAGVAETLDRGKTWQYCNKGLTADFMPDPSVEYGHDPHLLVMNQANPKELYQQNHCGIFKSVNGGESWDNLSEAEGVVSSFGFCVAVDEESTGTFYTIPGVSDEMRQAVDGALCVQKSIDGGMTFEAMRAGLPQENCFDIVYRHGLDYKHGVLLFGTTTGNMFLSCDSGHHWQKAFGEFPTVYSVQLI